MQINSVHSYDKTFGAKLRVINKDFTNEIFSNLSKKAENIGLEYDVIELNYAEFQDIVENNAFRRKNVLCQGIKRLSDVFKGRFIPCGDDFGTDHFEKMLTADKYADMWKEEEIAAEKYLYILGKKYSV